MLTVVSSSPNLRDLTTVEYVVPPLQERYVPVPRAWATRLQPEAAGVDVTRGVDWLGLGALLADFVDSVRSLLEAATDLDTAADDDAAVAKRGNSKEGKSERWDCFMVKESLDNGLEQRTWPACRSCKK